MVQMSRLEISEVVLVHCNIVNNYYQHNSRVLYIFTPNELFGQSKILYFQKPLIQSFHILRYGLLIKIINHDR